ncbi:MAG: HupE/UreJ family protein [Woeseiaceae bacterium]
MIERWAVWALLACAADAAVADEYRPAFLEIRQTAAEDFDVLWKVPAQGDRRLSLYVKFSSDVQLISPVRTELVNGAFLERYRISRSGGLGGAEIAIEGLSGLATDVLVRIEHLDGHTRFERMAAANPAMLVGDKPTRLDVARTYTFFGIEHILEGQDHLLFVACLVFIARTARRILVTITGFTIAHSITLSLAALDVVTLPIPPIEAVIALSIVFLAREITLNRRDTLTWRYPIFVSGSFGLMHGFGFAAALGEVGLPQHEIPAALFAFNVGVEIGQVLFVGAIMLFVWMLIALIGSVVRLRVSDGLVGSGRIQPVEIFMHLEKPVAIGVGSIAIFWTIERFAGFWS